MANVFQLQMVGAVRTAQDPQQQQPLSRRRQHQQAQNNETERPEVSIRESPTAKKSDRIEKLNRYQRVESDWQLISWHAAVASRLTAPSAGVVTVASLANRLIIDQRPNDIRSRWVPGLERNDGGATLLDPSREAIATSYASGERPLLHLSELLVNLSNLMYSKLFGVWTGASLLTM